VNWLYRQWWVLRNWVRYPYRSYLDMVHWWTRPMIGDKIIDCRNEVHTVVGILPTEDDLILEDGHHASWIHCCEHLPK
jgi:hypothetical protein